MPWFAFLAIAAMLAVQMGFVGACLYAYTRIRTTGDARGHEIAGWAAKVELAVTNADSAKRMVETIEVDKYNRLRTRTDELESELKKCQINLKICETKISSEERMERRREKAAGKAGEDDEVLPAAPGGVDVDDLIRQHGIPMSHQPAPAVRPPQSNFGRVRR